MMLRRWSRALPTHHRRVQLRVHKYQQQCREIWNTPTNNAGFFSWLGFDLWDKSEERKPPIAKPEHPVVPLNLHDTTENRATAVDPAFTTLAAGNYSEPPLPDFNLSTNATDVAVGNRAWKRIERLLSTKTKVKQLLSIWEVIAQGKSFVVDGSLVRQWEHSPSESSAQPLSVKAGNSGDIVYQMVPTEVFERICSEIGGINKWVVGSVATTVTDRSTGEEGQKMLLLSESCVIELVLVAFARLGDQIKVMECFEAYNHNRIARLDTLLASSIISMDEWSSLVEQTKLRTVAYRTYLTSLSRLGRQKQVVDFFRDKEKMRVYIDSLRMLRIALTACAEEHEGDLARDILDIVTTARPLLMIPVQSYQSAMQANLKTPDRTHQQLDNALHVYRRMETDAGYILHPNVWSTLVNACVYLNRTDEAFEIMSSYAKHGIAPFQRRFVQAIRTACKFQQFDVVIKLIRYWIQIDTLSAATKLSTSRKGQKPRSVMELEKLECECFNKILWEMLKGEPTLSQLTQVLELMEQRQAPANSQVIRRVVNRCLQIDKCAVNSQKSPQEIVKTFVDLWERVPHMMERNSFVMHLLVDFCLEQQWEDQWRYLIDYAIDNRIDLPMGSVVNVMERYNNRGEFEKCRSLGEKLLAISGEKRHTEVTNNQKFFEALFMSALREEDYDWVLLNYKSYMLDQVFPRSEIFPIIVRDAEALQKESAINK